MIEIVKVISMQGLDNCHVLKKKAKLVLYLTKTV